MWVYDPGSFQVTISEDTEFSLKYITSSLFHIQLHHISYITPTALFGFKLTCSKRAWSVAGNLTGVGSVVHRHHVTYVECQLCVHVHVVRIAGIYQTFQIVIDPQAI